MYGNFSERTKVSFRSGPPGCVASRDQTATHLCHSACNLGSDSNLMQSLIRVALPLGESAPCNKHFATPVWCRVGLLSKVRSTRRTGPFLQSARLADLVFVHRAERFLNACIAVIGAA